MVKVSHAHNFAPGYLVILFNLVEFNADNELNEIEKLIQKDGHEELKVQRATK